MINKDYISFEVAKLLKKKGFKEHCGSLYWDSTGQMEEHLGNFNTVDQEEDNPHSSRAEHWQVLKWLIAAYNIFIQLDPMERKWSTTLFDVSRKGYKNDDGTNSLSPKRIYTDVHTYKTPEQAIEIGIRYTLKHLI